MLAHSPPHTHTQARTHTHTAPLSSVTSIFFFFFIINPFSIAASFRAQDSLESAGASPTCLGAKVAPWTSRQQAKFTLAYTPPGNLQSPIHLTYCECKTPHSRNRTHDLPAVIAITNHCAHERTLANKLRHIGIFSPSNLLGTSLVKLRGSCSKAEGVVMYCTCCVAWTTGRRLVLSLASTTGCRRSHCSF